MSDETKRCEHCGASLNKYWHRLTPVLVNALVKTLEAVHETDNNCVRTADLPLTKTEYCNYQKLRFHGLIARHRNEDGVWDGSWLITKRGGQFLRGEISVPAKVQTFRNRVVDHSEQTVTIKDIYGSVPWVQQDFEPEPMTQGALL